MVSKIRIFPITGYGSDGYPTYGTPLPLCTLQTGETERNNIRVKLTARKKSKTLEADDGEDIVNAITGHDGEIEVYGADADALAAILPTEKDASGNVHFLAGPQTQKEVGVFFEGRAGEKGKKYQIWYYVACFSLDEDEAKTDTDNAESITLNFIGKAINTSGTGGNKTRTHVRVYEGNTGWVNGEPTASSIVKYVAAQNL